MKPRSDHAQDNQYFQRKETPVRYRRASFKNLSLGTSRKVYLLGDGGSGKVALRVGGSEGPPRDKYSSDCQTQLFDIFHPLNKGVLKHLNV